MSDLRRVAFAGFACAAIVAWLVVVVRGVFDLSDPNGRAVALDNLSQLAAIFTRIPRNAGYLFPVLLFVASGFGAGDAILGGLRVRPESRIGRVAFALSLGMVCWLAAAIAVGMPGFLNRGVLGALLAAGIISTAWRCYATRAEWGARPRAPRTESPARWPRVLAIAVGVLLAFNLYLSLLGALAPEVEFDGRFYHLAEAKRYADHQALFNLAASQHSSEVALPQNQEILYAAAIELFGMPAAKLLSWSNLLLSILAMVGFAAEFFADARIGMLASLLFASAPIVAWSGSTTNNDLSMAPYTLLAIYAVFLWNGRPQRWGWLAVAGLFCGFALGIKSFSALTFLALALVAGGLAIRAGWPAGRAAAVRSAAIALALFVAATAIGGLPNFVREWITTGDPFYPIAGQFWHSPYWWPLLEPGIHGQLTAFGADTSWRTLPVMAWAFTMHPDRYRDVIGPIFLFASPFVLIYGVLPKSNPVFRRVLLLLAIWSVLWFATQYVEARYALGLFPATMLLAAFLAYAGDVASLAGAVPQALYLAALLGLSLANAQLIVPVQRGALLQQDFGYIKYNWDYLYRGLPERDVQLQYAPMVEYMNAHLDPHRDKVYAATPDILYGSYSDIDFYDGLVAPSEGYQPWSPVSPDALRHLREERIDYVLVPQNQEAALEKAPLYPYLAETHRTDDEVLYRVCAVRCSRPPSAAAGAPARLAAPGFYRHADEASVYRLAADGTYCIVRSMDQMNAFGGFSQVRVRDASFAMLQGYKASPSIGCAWPNGYYQAAGAQTIYGVRDGKICIASPAAAGGKIEAIESEDVLGQKPGGACPR